MTSSWFFSYPTIERFHIHKEAASHNHLNDEHTITPNRIFDSILKITSSVPTLPPPPPHTPGPPDISSHLTSPHPTPKINPIPYPHASTPSHHAPEPPVLSIPHFPSLTLNRKPLLKSTAPYRTTPPFPSKLSAQAYVQR